MAPKVDLINQRFGRLIVVSKAPSINGRGCWTCICDCGTTLEVRTDLLKTGKTTSCGCYHKEVVQNTHGTYKVKLHNIWSSLIRRTSSTTDPSFHYYSSRGITVCKEWRNFDNFYADMEPTYQDGLEILRVDNNLGYCKSNCIWSSRA